MLEGPWPSSSSSFIKHPAHLLFYAHRVRMSYIVTMLVLVSCMSTHNHLSYFFRFCAGSIPKIPNKTSLQQRTLAGCLTISLYNYALDFHSFWYLLPLPSSTDRKLELALYYSCSILTQTGTVQRYLQSTEMRPCRWYDKRWCLHQQ